MLRVSFSSMTTARAAVNVLEAYGFSAKQFGRDIVTDCPTLLAVSTIQKRLGFAEIERLDLGGGAGPIDPIGPIGSTPEFWPEPGPVRAGPSGEATA